MTASSAADGAELVRHVTGDVQVLRINRPDARNAMNTAVRSGIGLAIASADADPDIQATVLTGTGDRAFCAGADLRRMSGSGARPEPTDEEARGLEAYKRFVREGSVKPVIGAANGSAVGGGFELLLACDVIVAADHAVFGLPEVKRGLLPGSGGCHLGVRIPVALALELCLTGDSIDAHRALALGLVNRVVRSGEVVEEAMAMATRIAANGPLAVRAVKRLVLTAVRHSPQEAWRVQDEIQPSIVSSEDAREGAAAFIEKRPPTWRAR